MSTAAVIILNYNGVHFLEKFLPSVVAHSKGHRLIVADNASTDDSRSFLSKEYPQIEIIAFDQNHGFAQGYNLALRDINNPYSILLNSDVEVTAGWIEPVLEMMERDARVVAAQPKIRAYHQPNHFEHAGAAGGYIDRLGYPFCRGRIFDQTELDAGQYDDRVPVFWASGACFFVRTEAFRRFGGFDPLFHAHMEEIDLCWRLLNRDWRIVCCGESAVYHVGGGTLHKSNPRKTFLNYRNNLMMIYKNMPVRQRVKVLLVRLVLDGLSSVRFMMAGSWPDVWAIVRAHFAFYRLAPTINEKTNRPPRQARLYRRSVVWEYFVKGTRKFSELPEA